ncbi:hypothetical protein P167DRAFT_575996 [Morchella conica CCBAS932]|uniref:Uncharacterized protein n=1 Tax=Morchella conica CCBAS932 TaxID=1392247 RepID=A0A3N4KMS3_9PEZI|nr:hypothetical protein P167DRAFT_575996 [Morchella conica CCBAS932]
MSKTPSPRNSPSLTPPPRNPSPVQNLLPMNTHPFPHLRYQMTVLSKDQYAGILNGTQLHPEIVKLNSSLRRLEVADSPHPDIPEPGHTVPPPPGTHRTYTCTVCAYVVGGYTKTFGHGRGEDVVLYDCSCGISHTNFLKVIAHHGEGAGSVGSAAGVGDVEGVGRQRKHIGFGVIVGSGSGGSAS